MEMYACRRCSRPLTQVEPHAFTCGEHTIYANSAPACSVVISNPDDQFLVGVRKIEPFAGGFDLAGGFADHHETFEAAAHRELAEEVGIGRADHGGLSYLASVIDLYPFAGETVPVIAVVFSLILRRGATIEAGDDIAELLWLDRSDVDPERFVFGSGVAGARWFLDNPPTPS